MFETEKSAFLKTPKDALSFLILTLFVYATAPIFEWIDLEHLLASGKLPTNADSIGLGFAFFAVAWFLGIPIVLTFVCWILWKYPAQVSLFGFNSKYLVWSFIWTFIFLFLVSDCLSSVLIDFTENNFIGVLQDLILIYLFLVFRASIVFRKGEMKWDS